MKNKIQPQAALENNNKPRLDQNTKVDDTHLLVSEKSDQMKSNWLKEI